MIVNGHGSLGNACPWNIIEIGCIQFDNGIMILSCIIIKPTTLIRHDDNSDIILIPKPNRAITKLHNNSFVCKV
jgi:hypothetical protein